MKLTKSLNAIAPSPALAIAMAALSFGLLAGCGNSNYSTQAYQATASGGDQQVITKAKVDIVLFQDNSDSVMYSSSAGVAAPINQLMPQMASFAANLDSTVDYRFIVMPLFQSNEYATSKYILASDCSTVTVGTCLTPDQVGTFNNASGDQSWITSKNSAIGSSDYGFANMINNLNNRSMLYDTSGGKSSNRFFRDDASTAIIVMTNGNDVDGAQYSVRSDGVQYISGYDNTHDINYSSYFNNFKNGQGISYYPVVANGDSCYGKGSYAGTRYLYMRDLLNNLRSGSSVSYDLCNGQMTSILTNMFQNVQELVQNIQFNYVVINSASAPNVSSIVVKKNGVVIPQSATNGWQYVGQYNGPTSFYPTSGNNRSGYALQLSGSAVYQGSDNISVTYTL